ncbi:putative RNA processing protein Grc3 [Aspergillus novofumigatus IBT 16806]|uniref:Polynucleotide 5'-hydroxyl-kinase GRC3 n=1 Tax=Aspergillus novofumigatus (strain IBT 16806) TaxID=1392255 RepID=A0A2I1CKI0_ASPN1|nr:polynucleotide 5'-hydroxyl-kinase grc3 [Aspergillus novofumigatus IBT 16806]PKX98130.1 polynucleotide 5'-hydroxyl-kinase grc3 [Aspergillus novofumigatus IBT 16806]
MKRKAEKQQATAPVSAFAARKARQQQAQPVEPEKTAQNESVVEPPSKRARWSPEEGAARQAANGNDRVQPRRSTRRKAGTLSSAELAEKQPQRSAAAARAQIAERTPAPEKGDAETSDAAEEEDEDVLEEENGVGAIAVEDDAEGYESPADDVPQVQNFPLSKTRLNKSNIVSSDEHTLCVCIKEKMTLVLLGHYDLWVKRGVISLMGAKLHPSPRLYRVYAPSTHSLPVIKCVAGVDGEAEIEVKSCHSGIYRLRHLSPLYQRIWNGKNTPADKLTLKNASASTKRTFSVLYTSSDDSWNRHLRPLHLEKQWSSAIRSLSQRGGRLKVLICGPKASGKSTFSRYLLNHLLSPAPQTENKHRNTDGVAFLDLDPGQPEFSPMGQVYLAHLRSPFFGPPFTHPSLAESKDGSIIRSHLIGATSPKEDPDHYVLAAMDLMDRYRALLASYPQCPLIINYPGWIFGLGLEVATWLVKSLGLSDVVYMSEKGPSEVVEPLGQAAQEARVPLTTLPSQPTDFVSRSSAQLRSMQVQSYFHMSHPSEIHNPQWLDTTMSRTRPLVVDYAGPRQGIRGIMVMGSQISPDLLHEALDGALVGVVAAESPNAIMGQADTAGFSGSSQRDAMQGAEDLSDAASDVGMNHVTNASHGDAAPTSSSSFESMITRTPNEDLPYLFVGSGSCNPLDPKASNCLGLALVRSIDVPSCKLELITPIPGSKLRDALEQGHGIVLVRGMLDNPSWAISEDYYAARAVEKRHQELVAKTRKEADTRDGQDAAGDADTQGMVSAVLRDRIRRASNVPWMTVIENNSRRHWEAAQREKSLWKLRKKAYPGSESETDW